MGGILKAAGASSKFEASNPYGDAFLQDANQNYSAIRDKQNTLGGALVGQMNGSGPNPAQSQFMGNTQANIANAQGLIASQRGLNPALAARMGANAAAQANQQQANQAATLQAQQQLAAQQQLQQLYASQQQGELAHQGMYGGAQQNTNQMNANIQGQNAGIVGNTIGGLMNAAGGIGSALLTGGASAAAPAAAGAMGGGGGGVAAGKMPTADDYDAWTHSSKGGKINGKPKVSGDSEANDTVPAMLSPGEIVVPRSKAHDPEKAKEFIDHLLKSKSKDDGDSGYGKILEHKRKVAELEKRVKSLEGRKKVS